MDQKRIGAFIAQCRKEKNLTQIQLAELLGITNQAVSKWENGKRNAGCVTFTAFVRCSGYQFE